MTNEGLITHLKKGSRVLQSKRVEAAFASVDRNFFVPEEFRDEAYGDYPLPLGCGATISEPTTVAFMLEKLAVKSGERALDVGSGSGWTTALLAHLVGPKGEAIGLEIVPELVKLGRTNIQRFYSGISKVSDMEPGPMPNIRLPKRGVVGLPDKAPFDRILVSAAAEELPDALMEQLKIGGRMVIPIRDSIWVVKKTEGAPVIEKFPGFAFVPLVIH